MTTLTVMPRFMYSAFGGDDDGDDEEEWTPYDEDDWEWWSYYVLPHNGKLAVEPGIIGDALRHGLTGGLVMGYQKVGMEHTYDLREFVPLDPPQPYLLWVRDVRFPHDKYGEPTFVRVFWRGE